MHTQLAGAKSCVKVTEQQQSVNETGVRPGQAQAAVLGSPASPPGLPLGSHVLEVWCSSCGGHLHAHRGMSRRGLGWGGESPGCLGLRPQRAQEARKQAGEGERLTGGGDSGG